MSSAKKKKKKPKRATQPPVKMTPAKRAVFTAILIAIPALFFVFLEIGLRLGHYGGNLDLLLVKNYGGRRYYQLNKNVARRYFSSRDLAVPELFEEVFPVQKEPNTFRIFFLGGSTTAGFPFELNARVSSLLEDRLQALFPGKNIEVVNFGISAVNSYTVLDFIHELVHYQPDLFLLYMGHNEFYGALGVGSTEYLGRNRSLIKLYLKLEHFKTFLWLKNTIARIQGGFRRSGPAESGRTLMANVVRKRAIPYGSPDYRTARKNFEANLKEILETARRHKIPILASTLVCNLRSLEPFVSTFYPALPDSLKKSWAATYNRGNSLLKQGDFGGALASFEKAYQLDSTYAECAFRMGQCCLKLGKDAQAHRYFRRAADLDALRFRASEEFNQIIEQVSAKLGVPVVKMDSVFDAHSPHKIVGNELLFEHLHPNFNGYFLMAKAFASGMRRANFIVPAQNWPKAPPDSTLRHLSHVTPLDLKIGELRIRKLMSGWPFQKGPVPEQIPIRPSDPIEKIAYRYDNHAISWNQAHFDAAAAEEKEGRLAAALEDYRAVIKIRPDDYYPFLKMGNIYFQEKKYAEARRAYEEARKRNPSAPFTYAKLGFVALAQNRPGEAYPFLQKALILDSKRPVLKGRERGVLLYYLASLDAARGKRADALKEVGLALKNFPRFSQALALQQELAEH